MTASPKNRKLDCNELPEEHGSAIFVNDESRVISVRLTIIGRFGMENVKISRSGLQKLGTDSACRIVTINALTSTCHILKFQNYTTDLKILHA